MQSYTDPRSPRPLPCYPYDISPRDEMKKLMLLRRSQSVGSSSSSFGTPARVVKQSLLPPPLLRRSPTIQQLSIVDTTTSTMTYEDLIRFSIQVKIGIEEAEAETEEEKP